MMWASTQNCQQFNYLISDMLCSLISSRLQTGLVTRDSVIEARGNEISNVTKRQAAALVISAR